MSERAATFDALYRRDRDPWRFETSGYEAAKYARTLSQLPARRFRRGLEVGCSIGVLTEQLSERCDHLIAVDVAQVALREARARCRCAPVEFVCADVPSYWPLGSLDLIVFSEVLYFLEASEIDQCASMTTMSAARDAFVILVNYLGECDRPLNGDAAADRFIGACGQRGLAVRRAMRDPRYRIDVLTPAPLQPEP